jgi:hypothetical protein
MIKNPAFGPGFLRFPGQMGMAHPETAGKSWNTENFPRI